MQAIKGALRANSRITKLDLNGIDMVPCVAQERTADANAEELLAAEEKLQARKKKGKKKRTKVVERPDPILEAFKRGMITSTDSVEDTNALP